MKSERATKVRLWCVNNLNNRSNANGNNLDNNNGRALGIGKLIKLGFFSCSMTLYSKLCEYNNLFSAFEKAREGKTQKLYVLEFEKNLKYNLLKLQYELLFHKYKPEPLKTFILRDPKTRKINRSAFRDRIVHHAICNIIEPLFDKQFIYDSYANRIGKGTFKAVERFEYFQRKVSKNNTRRCYVLKADIQHYFETVDHNILVTLLQKQVHDENVISLIKIILSNYTTDKAGKGMPLGNLTSQFFANVYLNELDQFVKHYLKAKYYVRYVDDFVILYNDWGVLERYKNEIDFFLKSNLKLLLHPFKSKILRADQGVNFLGFIIFPYYRRLRKKNINKFDGKFKRYKHLYAANQIEREKVIDWFEGWLAYISHANTYKYRQHITRQFTFHFPENINNLPINIKKYENLLEKIESSKIKLSIQKTGYLFRKGLNIKQIAALRNLKQGTVWDHLARLIQYNQLSVVKVLPAKKILQILQHIAPKDGKLKEIKERIKNENITYDEINCVLASVKARIKIR